MGENSTNAVQFKLAHMFQCVGCVAFALVARSFWLSLNNPFIPFAATILLGIAVAILAERTKIHLTYVLLAILSVSVIQMGIYSLESIRNSGNRNFPHIVSFPYSNDFDIYLIGGVLVSIATLLMGGLTAASIRHFR